MSRPQVIVVAKRSNLSRLEEGEGDTRAAKLLRQGHEVVKKWRPAHDKHVATVDVVQQALEDLGAQALVLRGAHAAFDASGTDLVITVGGDGTVLAASHWVDSVPLLGINSAPGYSVGFFCAAQADSAKQMIAQALEGRLRSLRLSRMAVSINGELRAERVLNEALFCHTEPAATSNYILRAGRAKEVQRSSGIWVGPPAGSTGAIRSAGGRILPLTSRRLQMVVREPYMGDGRRYRLLKEVVGERASVSVFSKMDSAGVFLDGPYRRLAVALGDEVRFSTSDQPLTLLGLRASRQA